LAPEDEKLRGAFDAPAPLLPAPLLPPLLLFTP